MWSTSPLPYEYRSPPNRDRFGPNHSQSHAKKVTAAHGASPHPNLYVRSIFQSTNIFQIPCRHRVPCAGPWYAPGKSPDLKIHRRSGPLAIAHCSGATVYAKVMVHAARGCCSDASAAAQNPYCIPQQQLRYPRQFRRITSTSARKQCSLDRTWPRPPSPSVRQAQILHPALAAAATAQAPTDSIGEAEQAKQVLRQRIAGTDRGASANSWQRALVAEAQVRSWPQLLLAGWDRVPDAGCPPSTAAAAVSSEGLSCIMSMPLPLRCIPHENCENSQDYNAIVKSRSKIPENISQRERGQKACAQPCKAL